jgi:hypothetical protein
LPDYNILAPLYREVIVHLLKDLVGTKVQGSEMRESICRVAGNAR